MHRQLAVGAPLGVSWGGEGGGWWCGVFRGVGKGLGLMGFDE